MRAALSAKAPRSRVEELNRFLKMDIWVSYLPARLLPVIQIEDLSSYEALTTRKKIVNICFIKILPRSCVLHAGPGLRFGECCAGLE